MAVQSNYARLSEVLPESAYLGSVRYINYAKDVFDMGNLFNYIVAKRVSFAYEHELRAVIKSDNVKSTDCVPVNDQRGLKVIVDLKKLIEAIYVSPDAKNPFRGVIEEITRTYGLLVPILQSGVNAAPAY